VPQTEPSIKSEKYQYHGCYDEHERRHRASNGSWFPMAVENDEHGSGQGSDRWRKSRGRPG